MTDVPPPGPPPAAPRKKHPLLFVALGCGGCGLLLLLLGVGGTMMFLLMKEQSARAPARPLPAAWRDSIRASYRLPGAVNRLATPATEDGDAALWLAVPRTFPDSEAMFRSRAVRHLGQSTLTAADSATALRALRDPGVDSAARAARQRNYDVLGRLDEAGPARLMPPLGPGLRIGGMGASRGADKLLLRGEARRWKGDLAGARADFSAAVALGRIVWTQESNLFGSLVGRRLLRAGADGLGRVAAQTRDAALAADADSLRAFVDRRGLVIGSRRAELLPDSLLLLAQDTGLTRGARNTALETICAEVLIRPMTHVVTGVPQSILDGVRDLTRDADPVVARAAVMADSTLQRMESAGIRGRYRLATGRLPR